jgi:hypothetical protein
MDHLGPTCRRCLWSAHCLVTRLVAWIDFSFLEQTSYLLSRLEQVSSHFQRFVCKDHLNLLFIAESLACITKAKKLPVIGLL